MKRIHIGDEQGNPAVIDVTWIRAPQDIVISCGKVQTASMTLREFFDALGISSQDCEKAFGLRRRLTTRR